MEGEVGRKTRARGVFISRGEPTIVFLTVCTKSHARWLARKGVEDALVECWRAADRWLVGRYVLMPDHLHMFCAPVDETTTLETWMKYWKRLFTQKRLAYTGAWLRGGWDRRLRRIESYEEKWNYVRDNPVRAGLVTRAEDWPFQGTLHDLRW